MNTALDVQERVDVLTKEQIQFLQKPLAKVCFRYAHGQATIEAENKHRLELNIKCAFGFHGYGRTQYEQRRSAPTRCFTMIHTPEFTPEWLTVTKLLRAGDEIELEFVADGWSNQYTNVATGTPGDGLERYEQLHVDHMRLHVRRKGHRLYTFIIAESICPDNSARMIQF